MSSRGKPWRPTPFPAHQFWGKRLVRGRINLLFTNVVMPKMNGAELAGEVTKLRPDIKVLFMSGYTADAVVRHGILQDDGHFLQKPVTPKISPAPARCLGHSSFMILKKKGIVCREMRRLPLGNGTLSQPHIICHASLSCDSIRTRQIQMESE